MFYDSYDGDALRIAKIMDPSGLSFDKVELVNEFI